VLVEMTLLPWPILGNDRVYGVMGWGDLLFLTLFLSAAQRFEFGLRRNFWAQVAAITIGFILAQTLHELMPEVVGLPALPFMAVFLIMANRGQFRLSTPDRRRIAVFIGILALVLAAKVAVKLRRPSAPLEPVEATAAVTPPALPATPPWQPANIVAASKADEPLWPPEAEASPADGPAVGQVVAPDADAEEVRAWAAAGFHCAAPRLPTPDTAANHYFNVAGGLSQSLEYRQGVAVLRAVARLGGGGKVALVLRGAPARLGLALAAAQPAIAALVLRDVGDMEITEGELATRSAAVRETWSQAFAPERYAARTRIPTLLLSGTNTPDAAPEAVSRLYERLAGPKRLVLAANRAARLGPEDNAMAVTWMRYVLAGGPAPPLAPSLTLSNIDGHLDLSAEGVPSAATLRFVLAVSSGDKAASAGRWWASVEPRPGARQVTVAISPPAVRVAAFAEVIAADGARVCSSVHDFRPAALRLRLEARPFSTPDVAPFQPGLEDWRGTDARLPEAALSTEEPDTLVVRVPPGFRGAEPVGVETNRTDALRRLGPRARLLRLEAAVSAPPRTLTVEIIERYGQPSERRLSSSLTVTSAGLQDLAVPLNRLRPAPGAERGPVSWADVDGLALHLAARAGLVWRVRGLVLTGADAGPVRVVDEP
jgi:hypothetical protein